MDVWIRTKRKHEPRAASSCSGEWGFPGCVSGEGNKNRARDPALSQPGELELLRGASARAEERWSDPVSESGWGVWRVGMAWMAQGGLGGTDER